MEDSTSIMALPNKAANGGSATTMEIGSGMGGGGGGAPAAAGNTIPPQYMNQIINGIQQVGGATLGNLPSRDIPMHTMEIQQDPQIRANYIPQPPLPPPQSENSYPRRDYINEYEERRRIASDYLDGVNSVASAKRRGNKLEDIEEEAVSKDEIYITILAAILFFLFHMPAVSSALYKYARFLHKDDGNITVSGIFVKSIVFGAVFYGIYRVMNYLS